MRSSRTSNVKAKELTKKYTAKRQAKQANIVQVNPQQATPTQAGIAGPGQRAYNPVNEEGRVVSRDVAGDEIKRDAEGEYDLTQVTGSIRDSTPDPKSISEQFIRGVLAPTEQFVQMPKDIIEGVKSEDQVMKETAFDLALTPLIKPFITAQDRGVTDKQWYSPISFVTDEMARSIGLKDNNALPGFLQNDGTEKRDFIGGMSDNIGAAGDVLGHDSTYHGESSIGAGYEKSGERFMEAPAYYAGTALGEIPYWVIGVGQISAAAKVSVKSIQYTAKTGQVANPRLLAKAYQHEIAVKKLEKGIQKENKYSHSDDKGLPKKEILSAVKTIRRGYGVHFNIIKKDMLKKAKRIEAIKKIQKEREKALNAKGEKPTQDVMEQIQKELVEKKELVKFVATSKDDMNIIIKKSESLDDYKTDINRIETLTGEDKRLERIILNKQVQTVLLPEIRTFSKEYSKAVVDANANSRIRKMAKRGVNFSNKVKYQLNPMSDPNWTLRVGGDDLMVKKELTTFKEIKKEIDKRQADGYYNTAERPPPGKAADEFDLNRVTGVMGVLRYEKDILGGAIKDAVNSKYSFYGRKKQMLHSIGETVSTMTVGLREFKKGEFKTITETSLKKRKDLEANNKKLLKDSKSTPEATKLIKTSFLYAVKWGKKREKLKQEETKFKTIIESNLVEDSKGRWINADAKKINEAKTKLKQTEDEINLLDENRINIENIIKSKEDIDPSSVGYEFNSKIYKFTKEQQKYISNKKRLEEIWTDGDKSIIDDISRNREQIKYLKHMEENPMENVWWVTNPKSIEKADKQTYIMDIGALEKAVPGIGKAWAQNTRITQAVRPSVSIKEIDGIITGEVSTGTNVGKKIKRTGKEEVDSEIMGDPEGMTFWVRDIRKKQADKEFGKAYTLSDGTVDQLGLDKWYKKHELVKNKYGLRTVKGRKTALPKKEKWVRKIEFYKPEDALLAAGQKRGVNAIYVIPKGLSQKEKQMYTERHFLEKYEGTDLAHMIYNQGSATKGHFDIYVERKLPKQYVAVGKDGKPEKMTIQVRADKDVRAKEHWLDATDIIENRKMAQNRYDETWFTNESLLLTQELIDVTSNTSLQSVRVGQKGKDIKLRQQKLDDKWKVIKERRQQMADLGIREVGDAKGTLFSMPLKILEDAKLLEHERLHSHKFVDTKTNKQYYSGGGSIYEIIDDTFDTTKVTNQKPKEIKVTLPPIKRIGGDPKRGIPGTTPEGTMVLDPTGKAIPINDYMDKHFSRVPGYEKSPYDEGRKVTAIIDDARKQSAEINLGGGQIGDQIYSVAEPMQYLGMPKEKLIGYTGPHAVNPGTPKYETVYPSFQTKGVPNRKLTDTQAEMDLTTAVRGYWDGDIFRRGTVYGHNDPLTGEWIEGPFMHGNVNLARPETYKDVLRKLKPEEETKLLKGTRVGAKIKVMEEGLKKQKQKSTKKTKDALGNVIEVPNTYKGSEGLQTATRAYVVNTPFGTKPIIGTGLLRHGLSNINIKTRKSIIRKLEKIDNTLKDDRLEFVSAQSDGLSDFQPLAASDQKINIFENHNLMIGFGGIPGKKFQNIRRMFATGDADTVTQGAIVGGINVHAMYQFDSTRHFLPDNMSGPLSKAEQFNTVQEANMLKSQKLDTYDKMERVAMHRSSTYMNEPFKVQHQGATKQFREKVVELYYKKVHKQTLDGATMRSIASDESQYLKIKNDIKDRNLIRTGRLKKKKNQNHMTPDEFGDNFSSKTYDDGSLITSGFVTNYMHRILGHYSGTRPQTSWFSIGGANVRGFGRFSSGTSSKHKIGTGRVGGRLGRLQEWASKKKNVVVEDIDVRTQLALRQAFEDLSIAETGELGKFADKNYQKIYDSMAGKGLTAEQIAMLERKGPQSGKASVTGGGSLNKKKNVEIEGWIMHPDGTMESLDIQGVPKWRDPLEKMKSPPDKAIFKEKVPGSNRAAPRKGSDDTPDAEFYDAVKNVVFEEAGMPIDPLLTSVQLSGYAKTIKSFKKTGSVSNIAAAAKKAALANKRKKYGKSTSFAGQLSGMGAQSMTGGQMYAQKILQHQQSVWGTVDPKTASQIKQPPPGRVGAVNTEKITEMMQQQQKQQADTTPTTLYTGVSSLLSGSQSPLPQAYGAEDSKLTSISKTVTQSFDALVKGGIKIGDGKVQQVKLSSSPTGGILGVNQKIIPQQDMKESVSTVSTNTASLMSLTPVTATTMSLTAPTTTTTSSISAVTTNIIPMTQQAKSMLSGSYSTMSALNTMLASGLKDGSLLKSNILSNRITPVRVTPSITPPMAPRVLPATLPIIPILPWTKPHQRRQQKRYKKKTGKAYWQTPQNWYEPYYWGGKDQMGPGYIVFKGKEPAKVRKYDQKWFGMDLGNLW